MSGLDKTLLVSSSPHVRKGRAVDRIMFEVMLALLPAVAWSLWSFGLGALFTLLTAIAASVLAEHLACRMVGRPSTVRDGSAMLTGLLFGLTLPPGLALWMVVVGAFIAIFLGKALFGGLGYNPFNPALVGRAVMQATFPVAMTTWVASTAPERFTRLPSTTLAWPLTQPVVDVVSGPTPLSAWKFSHQATDAADLFMGSTMGSAGETSAPLILLGGVYLVGRKVMGWRIPVTILATVAVVSGALWLWDPTTYASPWFHLFSGGLMLGAVFMATDMVGSPMTHTGVVLYGILIGVLVVVIRTWAGMPEGVMYAILLGNALAPHLDRLIQPRVYGTTRKGKAP